MRLRRSYDLHQLLTTFVVCAVATVLLTRSFLAATGYPQVGGSSLHIAHVLWGGLFLTAALITLLAFLSPAARPGAAVVGGVGFGLFIDEIGKFVTKDVDYFYRPAIALIYISFLLLLGVTRVLARRGFTADEALLIGIDALERAATGSLTDTRRVEVLGLLDRTEARGPLADGVRTLLQGVQAHAERESVVRRTEPRLRELWQRVTGLRYFTQLVYAALAVVAAVSIAETAWLLRHGVGDLTFSQKAFTATTVVADAMVVVGAIELVRSLLGALRWYEHAVLLEITVGQVFLYTSEQLEATLDLIGLLLLWVGLSYAIRFERVR